MESATSAATRPRPAASARDLRGWVADRWRHRPDWMNDRAAVALLASLLVLLMSSCCA